MATNYQINGIRFVPQGVVQADLHEGVAVKIEFPARGNSPVIEGVIIPASGANYEIAAVHFVQEEHGPYSMEEIYLLVTGVAQFTTPIQRVLKAIYNSYLNA